MIAEIIAVGSEMLTPFRQDTNSLYLTAGLNDLGVSVAFKTIIGDNLGQLTNAARVAIARADIVVFTGGLGPTEDDLTREAAAGALGLELHRNATIVTALYKRFAARKLVMPPNNAKQADVLEGATILENPTGSAPGQYLDTKTTILAGAGEIQLHFLCARPTLAEARARVDELTEKIEAEMDDTIFSSHGESLEEVVLLHLGMRHLTLAAAESCTGGLLAQRLTAIPGSSRYFLGGAVVYSDALKTTFAGVPADLITAKGPVSPEVARSLAEGIRTRTGASLGVAITGIAGPGPGEPGPDADKPIGLVYVALADGDDTQVKEFNLAGDRDRIRYWASQHALELIRRHLL